jgi:hypothetical protein
VISNSASALLNKSCVLADEHSSRIVANGQDRHNKRRANNVVSIEQLKQALQSPLICGGGGSRALEDQPVREVHRWRELPGLTDRDSQAGTHGQMIKAWWS